jgi:hypothetical protein
LSRAAECREHDVDVGRDNGDLGAQFVVDTAGRVERGSIAFLPGTNARLAGSARTSIARWHFTPAEIDGTSVRQIVQMPLSLAPKLPASPSRTFRLEGTADGWVHLINMRGGSSDVLQEWYDPDSVDAWVAEVRALNREGDALPKDVEMMSERSASLGAMQGIRFTAGYFRHGRALDPRSNIWGCGGAFNEGEQPVGDAAMFLDAARDARAKRSPPLDPNAVVYSANDVACPAWLPWRRSPQREFERVWQYPVGPYPASMRATNARADVLASFIVDTTGAPELATVRVMERSDARANKALSAALRTLRFRPATRSGVKVRQRVIQSIRFEPPPICATVRSGPACRRPYSER